jgi:23S rRNA (cytosine1962-C5)-methyltransferase
VHNTAIVTDKGARRWQSGHPWIFRSDVSRPPSNQAGTATVLDSRGKELGCALWSPRSEIALRLLDRNPNPKLDHEWFVRRIGAALRRRQGMAEISNAYRVVHAEGDALPSLVVDRYDRYLVVQLLSAGLESCRTQIVSALQELLTPVGILARNDVAVREREGLPREVELLAGDVPRDVEISEHGVRYLAAPWDGQKTGAFLDQRENRQLMGTLATGAALDCFSYHGSFAMHLARGADRVIALDSSQPALERAIRNAALNGFSNVQAVQADVFDFLRNSERDGTRFDTIVLDPPAFAKNKASLAAAIRGYRDINLRALKVLAPRGLLFTASCSYHLSKSAFLDMLADAAGESGRRVVLREIRGQPVDHPEILTIPETGYLKGALLQVMDS